MAGLITPAGLSIIRLNKRAILQCMVSHKSYSRSRNSVEQIPFEIAKSIFQQKPFWSDERIRLLRRFVKKKPTATLQELCEWMKQDYGLTVSKTEMCRARIRLGFRRNRYGLR